jgi:PAS domain S-box-containing protein/putative nucleotidyltransferase with HDIG domain
LHASDEQVLLNDICRIVCDDAGYRMAWVGYAEQDETRTVRPVAWAGAEDGYLTGAVVSWADTEYGRGPTGTAIRSGATVYIQDFASDPLMAPWRASALRHGYHSSIALPLRGEDAGSFGALTIYSSEPDAFTPGEIRLLEEMAANLAFGIVGLRTRLERMRAEEALQASEQRYRDVFDNSSDLLDLLQVTEDGRFKSIEVNRAFEISTGLSREEVIGKAQEDVTPAEVTEAVNAQYRRCIEARVPVSDEMELCMPSGSHYYNTTLIPLCDASGRVDRILSVSHDITGRRAAEKAAVRAAAYARNLIEASLDPLITIGPDGRITDVNRATERATGLCRDALIDTDFAAYFTDPEKASAGFHMALKEGSIRDYPLTMRNVSSGEVIDVLYNSTTYVNDEGDMQGVFAAARDMTQVKKAESETRNVLLEMVEAIALTVEKRDPYTSGHQKRVAELASAIAERMSLDDVTVEGVRIGAMIHDIGKIHVPAEILSRPGKLSPAEWQIMTTHPSVGAEIVQGVHAPWPLEQMIRQHHERLDGSGYPQGLKDGDILLEARILAVADVVEAMASHRPYRAALGIEAALEEVARGRNTLFDARAVDACLALFRDGFELSS